MNRALHRLFCVGLLSIAVVAPAGAEDRSPAMLETVEAFLDLEQQLLDEERQRFDQVRTRRTAAMTRLNQLYRSLDASLDRDEGEGRDAAPAPDFELLLSQLADAEGEREAAFEVERLVLTALRDRMRRLALLEEQRDEQLGRPPAETKGRLSGRWTLNMLPIAQRGTWRIEQSGALINGTYELDGGWSGSLQGTLVDRKLFLVRIDSKLGKVMEYEGFVSADGDAIRGTWLNYELAGADGSTGQFAAQRAGDP